MDADENTLVGILMPTKENYIVLLAFIRVHLRLIMFLLGFKTIISEGTFFYRAEEASVTFYRRGR